MIEIKNKKLVDLLTQKNVLVKAGRKISSELETLEFKIKKYQDKEKIITGKTEPKDLMAKIEVIKGEMDRKMVEFEAVAKEIETIKLNAIPKEMKDEHMALIAKRVEMETERNKIALKIQKIKDKAIPIIKKEVIPFLKEYDDIETAEVKGDVVQVQTFNHLEQFKNSFKKK